MAGNVRVEMNHDYVWYIELEYYIRNPGIAIKCIKRQEMGPLKCVCVFFWYISS